MPQLLRLRFVSIGHELARMDDLTLDFRDREGHATDSTLWLRNGGGKSSLLNLFFAVLRPNRTEFLGGRADARQRSLDDYVLAGDRALIVAEWQLDAPRGSLGLEVEQRFLTGVFHERRDSSSKLNRLYFATRVSADEPHSTLEGLPLYLPDSGTARKVRRSLSSFREAWLALRNRAPALTATVTDSQTQWQAELEAARIDPGLFAYQIRMNQREGGADDLFRFRDDEEFIDFLLTIALDPRFSDQVGHNIGQFRRELVQRKEQLIPERKLVSGLLDRFVPLRQLHEERRKLYGELKTAAGELQQLRTWSEKRREVLITATEQAELQKQEQLDAAAAARHNGEEAENMIQALLWRAAETNFERLTAGHDEQQQAVEKAAHQLRIWRAAVPLRRAMESEWRVEDRRKQVEAQRNAHAPLRGRLSEAASGLAATLRLRAGTNRHAASEAREREKQLRAAARQQQQLLVEAQVEQASSIAEASSRTARLQEVTAARMRLEQQGVLTPAETAAAALKCYEADEKQATQALADLDSRLLENGQHLQLLAHALHERTEELHEKRSLLQLLENDITQAQRARDNLASNKSLHAALELDEIDFDRIDASALQTLEGRARAEQDRLFEVRQTEATDQRAALHLEKHGLLPPPADVEQVRAALESQSLRAWSGWTWLAANRTHQAILEVIHNAPHLTTAVIVTEGQVPAAVRLLEKAQVIPPGPVVLADTAAFNSASGALPGGHTAVIGPAETAWFDPTAGQERLEVLRAGLDQYREQAAEAEQRFRATSLARDELRRFRTAYPAGWFFESRERLAAARAVQTQTEERLVEAQAEQRGAEAERERLNSERENGRLQLQQIRQWQQLVESFLREHDKPSAIWQRELAAARDAAEHAGSAAWQHEQASSAAESEAQAAAGSAAAHGEDARAFEEELATVQYLAEIPVAPRAGELEAQRDAYNRLRAEYEQRVGAEQLLVAAQIKEENARRERRSFNAQLRSSSLIDTEVQAALQALPEPDRVEEIRQQAEETSASQRGRLGNLTQQLDNAREKLKERTEQLGKRGIKPERALELAADVQQETLEALEAAAANWQQRAVSELETATAAQAAAAAASVRAETARRTLQHLGMHDSLFKNAVDTHSELLVQVAPFDQPDPSPAEEPVMDSGAAELDDEHFSQRLVVLNQDLQQLRKLWGELGERRSDAAMKMKQYLLAPEFRSLEVSLTTHLQQHEAHSLEVQALQLSEQLELRLQHLDGQLSGIEQHRSILMDQMLEAAEEGIRLIRSTSSRSRIPDHVPGLGGAQFIRISMNPPDDRSEQLGRLGLLIDELVDREENISGISLVQAAVRRLARPIRVRVLHPDPQQRQSVNIARMASFSGGEQLTGAILLYCTLVNIRARSRGLVTSPSSVLLLDNPIGRASRVRFLELQREVARAMGVQLIYTTGVNDHEALAALPNVIRLRNERQDRHSRNRLIEHQDPGSGGLLEAVRIARNPE